MTFRCTVGPPDAPQDSWNAKFWAWVTKVWFPKQRALGDPLEYDDEDRVSIPDNGIELTHLAQMPDGTVIGNIAGSDATPAALNIETELTPLVMQYIDDATHGLLSAAESGVEGDMLLFTGGAWTKFAVGTVGQAVESNGTRPVYV